MSTSTAAAPTPRDRWCAGLRHAGRRRLTLAEFDDLRVVLRSSRTQAVVTLLALVSSPGALVLLGLGAQWDALAPGVQVAALLLGVALVALGLPIASLRVRDLRRRSRALYADLRAGHVEHFRGRIERPNALDPAQRRLRRMGFLVDDPAVEQWLEVLPQCELVLEVNGRVVERPAQAPICDVSVRPGTVRLPPGAVVSLFDATLATSASTTSSSHPQSTALPVAKPAADRPPRPYAAGAGAAAMPAASPAGARARQRVSGVRDATLVVRRRQLTSDELRELQGYARRWHVPSGWTICWALVLALVLLQWPRQEATFVEFAQLYALQLSAAAAGLLLGVGFYVRDLLFARDVHRDQQLGWALTLHPPGSPPVAEDSDETPLREVLPASRCVWSEGGVPAPWRLVRW